MRRNLGNPDAEKVLQDRSIAFSFGVHEAR